jgi:hypothetical protein
MAMNLPLFEIVKPSGSSDTRRSGIPPGWGRPSGRIAAPGIWEMI